MTGPDEDLGIFAAVPMRQYHAWPGANVSRLKLMRDRSPAHVVWEREHPTPPTEAELIGEIVHEATLQPGIFAEKYIRGPEGDKRTKAVKEAWAAIESERPDAEILRPSDFDLAMSMRRAVEGHRIASRLLEGQAEQSARWRDPETDVLCKGRFDMISDRAPVLVDLKTTRDASKAAFERAIYSYGYYLQAAHYLNGAGALGVHADHFCIVAVEKSPPHCVAVYDLEGPLLAAGAEELAPLYKRWRECEESGEWPSYPEKAVEISVPPWAFRQIEARVG